MPAALFNGSAVKILKDILRSKSGIEVITGDTDNPTSVAKNAPASSLYLRSGTAEVYVKSDAGSSTNWTLLSTGSADPVFNVQSGSGTISPSSGATVLADTSGGAVTVNLPTPALDGFVRIKDSGFNANTNNITVVRNGAEDIDGVAASYVMNSDGESKVFVSDGTDWFVL